MKTPPNMTEPSTRGNGAVTHNTPKGEFRNFVSDVEKLVKATTSVTGDELVKAKAALDARVAAAKDSVEAMGEALSERVHNSVKITDNYVHAHPWQSFGLSAALGLIIGIAFARRK